MVSKKRDWKERNPKRFSRFDQRMNIIFQCSQNRIILAHVARIERPGVNHKKKKMDKHCERRSKTSGMKFSLFTCRDIWYPLPKDLPDEIKEKIYMFIADIDPWMTWKPLKGNVKRMA